MVLNPKKHYYLFTKQNIKNTDKDTKNDNEGKTTNSKQA